MSEGSAEKARLYLDVDGVLNAVSPGTPFFGWPAAARQQINGYPITWAPAFIELLNEVATTPGLGIYWLTTWCHDAPTILAPALGLHGEDWPVVGYEHWRRATGLPWWKHLAIVEHLDGFDGGVLWIDDDHGVDPGARAWLAGRPNVLPLAPETSLGITRDQADIITRFARDLTSLAGGDRG